MFKTLINACYYPPKLGCADPRMAGHMHLQRRAWLTVKTRLLVALAIFVSFPAMFAQGSSAQGTPATTSTGTSTQQTTSQNLLAQATSIAQRGSVPSPTILPTDVNPEIFSSERALGSRDLQFAILKRIPSRLWFSTVTEVSQRYESNVFFTTSRPRSDYIFRVLPNVTLGYDFYKNTSVYCNYFVIKDVFAYHQQLTAPTTMSLSLGFKQDIPLGRRLNANIDFQSRELWQAKHLRQADLLPSVSVSYVVNPNIVLFASSLLQMRSGNYFGGPKRELDPFYSWGAMFRKKQWTFVANSTLVTNYRNRNAIPPISNNTMIADFELSRPINKNIPGLVSFIRAEPVWNWGAPNNPPGLSGFDIRIFGGLRMSYNKPDYSQNVQNIMRQIKESEEMHNAPPAEPESDPNKPKQTSELSPAPMSESHGPILVSSVN